MPENKDVFPPGSHHELEWVEETIPRSLTFGDTYFSKDGGIDETRHVFIGGNELLDRWPQMETCTIAELGFGTGLNFLETLRRWRTRREPGATLCYIGFEAWPMARSDLEKSLSRWPELTADAAVLASHWPGRADILTIEFSAGASLVVHMSDAELALPKMNFLADAWYLDGFAPARNPQMWSAELMAEVFERTAQGGTFATYASAGWVRRNLIAAGFMIEKRPGFGSKREMLRGYKP